MTTTQIQSTSAGFLAALQSPDVFADWAAVTKDDYKAVSSFIASTLGLAARPSQQDLIEIETAMTQMLDGQPGVRAPRAVGMMCLAQSVTKDAPRHAPAASMCLFQHESSTLNADQRRAVAVGFLGALASPDVLNAWAAVSKDDQKAVAEFVQRALNLAEAPSAADLNAIHEIINEVMASQIETTEIRTPRHVGFIFATQNISGDVRAPRHVGFAFVAQSSEVDVRAPRHVGFAYLSQTIAGETPALSDDQRHAIAASFLHALQTHAALFEKWLATPKDDHAAIGSLVASALGLAAVPSADDLRAMAEYTDATLKPQVDELASKDVRVPRHVGVVFLLQHCEATITDADLRELLELARLAAD